MSVLNLLQLYVPEMAALVPYANVLYLSRDSKYLLQNDAKRDLENEIILNTPSRLEGKTRILRASDVLLSLAGRPTANGIHPLSHWTDGAWMCLAGLEE